jgi:hypothetical protein
MGQLNQVVAVEKGQKARSDAEATAFYHRLQREVEFNGIIRVYTPKDDEGEKLPNEGNRVQARVPEILDGIAAAWKPLYDVVLTKESANQVASADVVVDGRTILENVPVPVLLFLEKKLADFATVLRKIPVLDPAFNWEPDAHDPGLYRAEPVESIRTKKVPRNHVKAEATDRHPAQVDVYYEDIPLGRWSTTRISGAVPLNRKQELLARVAQLSDAVKRAREEANSTEVVERSMGSVVFDWLLA